MNCNKSELFMQRWGNESEQIKRKLTEFSLQLTPTKFADMINYKKILMDNIEPADIEMTVTSDGKEIYNLITDSKMKSLCLKYAKDTIKSLEFSAKNPDEVQNDQSLAVLNGFIYALNVETSAYGSTVTVKENFGACKVICNDTTIAGISDTKGLSFDVHTFNEGYMHTFVLRFELENGDMLSFYSAIGRDGSKGEKPKVFASAFIDGYYVSKQIENSDIY
ncbi:MAG: hypothetical protein R3Y09_02715 [Clostridia bacterium]